MKITGSFGTGKTTLAKELEKLGYSVSLDLEREFLHIEDKNEMQTAIFLKQLEVEDLNHTICDNSIITILAYSFYLLNTEDYKKMLIRAKRLINDKDLYVYTPIEFEIENDGVRYIDYEFQKQIDEKTRELLKDFNINYITVKGNLKERVKKILLHIKKQYI